MYSHNWNFIDDAKYLNLFFRENWTKEKSADELRNDLNQVRVDYALANSINPLIVNLSVYPPI